jgi:predicted metalloprotease with PDZ domain
LTLGGLEQTEPVASIGGRFPVLGYDLLHHFYIVFDQRNDLVRFYSKETGTIPAPSERSVGLSLKIDPAGWRIAGVIPGSPAEEARLAADDLVVRIEDRRATEWARDQIHDWIENHAAMALVVTTPSGAREVRLRVWSLVP